MLYSGDIQLLYGKFLIGIFFFIRILGITIIGPIFSSTAIPNQIKAFLSAVIAVIMTTAYWDKQPTIDLHLWNLAFIGFKEFGFGAVIGFAANCVFWAAKFAGGMLDVDMGFQTAMMFDSSADTPSLIGEYKNLIVTMIFLFLNGHHYIIEALFASASASPIGSFEITQFTVDALIKITTSVMIIGVKIASPVLSALFLTNVSLALLGRIAPQTNIFSMSFQVKVAVGLLVLMGSIPLFVFVVKDSLSGFQESLYNILLTLNHH